MVYLPTNVSATGGSASVASGSIESVTFDQDANVGLSGYVKNDIVYASYQDALEEINPIAIGVGAGEANNIVPSAIDATGETIATRAAYYQTAANTAPALGLEEIIRSASGVFSVRMLDSTRTLVPGNPTILSSITLLNFDRSVATITGSKRADPTTEGWNSEIIPVRVARIHVEEIAATFTVEGIANPGEYIGVGFEGRVTGATNWVPLAPESYQAPLGIRGDYALIDRNSLYAPESSDGLLAGDGVDQNRDYSIAVSLNGGVNEVRLVIGYASAGITPLLRNMTLTWKGGAL